MAALTKSRIQTELCSRELELGYGMFPEGALRDLAEQIHDGPLQTVGALALRLANLERMGSHSAGDVAWAELRALNARVGIELRRLVEDLSHDASMANEAGTHLKLDELIACLMHEFHANCAIDCQLRLEPAHLELRALPGVILGA